MCVFINRIRPVPAEIQLALDKDEYYKLTQNESRIRAKVGLKLDWQEKLFFGKLIYFSVNCFSEKRTLTQIFTVLQLIQHCFFFFTLVVTHKHNLCCLKKMNNISESTFQVKHFRMINKLPRVRQCIVQARLLSVSNFIVWKTKLKT